ncbi:MAG: Amino acid permease, partial [Actinomycetota bacterium]|nr:Amino acid permease [Actinomycetota bacterium]
QVFFSYIGFDAASTAGEEAKNPRRDLPRAILGSLVVVTILYILVAVAAIGARGGQPSEWEGQSSEAVLASIARDVTGSDWAPAIIALGAVISIFSVVLVTMYGQTRILFAMGRDGLLPKVFTKVNPRTQTPVNNTIIVAIVISILAAFVPLGQLAEATSIGTLSAFVVVNFGVIALWISRPELERTFKVPLLPLFPIVGAVLCMFLISALDTITWIVFAIWMIIGILLYLAYGRRHSNAPAERPAEIPADLAVAHLPTRSITPGTLVGIVMLLGIAAFAIFKMVDAPNLNAFHIVVWSLLVLSCVAGIWLAVQGLRQDKDGQVQATKGDHAAGASLMRLGIRNTTIGLVVPAVLLVLAVVVATPERADAEKANESSGATTSEVVPGG